MSPYIPRRDHTFNQWQDNLLHKAEAAAERLNIPPDAITAILAKQVRWTKAFKATEDPATRTKGTVKEKQEARAALEHDIRIFNNAYLIHNPAMTDVDRDNFGLPVHDTKPTPAPEINSRPKLEVNFNSIQRHTLTARNAETRGIGKPAHVAGFEIWRKVGDPAPANDADFQLVIQATRSPHVLNYDGAQSGLRVYYRVRWMNTRGVPGPWSETKSAIIA
jgi:hypothetical protein